MKTLAIILTVLVIAVIGVWVYMNFFGMGAAPHALNIDEIPPYEQYSYVIINNNFALDAGLFWETIKGVFHKAEVMRKENKE